MRFSTLGKSKAQLQKKAQELSQAQSILKKYSKYRRTPGKDKGMDLESWGYH